MELLRLGVENLGHRLWLGWNGGLALRDRRWYWRLGYALWLEGFFGPAHRHRVESWSEADLTYGETPLWTAYRLLGQAELKAGQRLVEIGCGRAIACLVAELVWGASATGFEVVPGRAAKAVWLTRALQTRQVEIVCDDAAARPLPAAALYYLTGTSWSEENWGALERRLAQAAPGARAISLSRPLRASQWRTTRQEKLPYSWGWAMTYWQTRL